MHQQTYADGVNIYSVYLMHKYVNNHEMPVEKLPITIFKRNMTWPNWGKVDGERWSILDVLNDPKKYNYDYKNILKSNLKYPIITVKTPLESYYILDGHHRLAKAHMKHHKTISAFVFTDAKLLKKFKLFKATKANWKKVDNMVQKDFDMLYEKRFN